MRPSVLLLSGLCLACLWRCTPFEEAAPTERKSFVHFFSSGTHYIGRVAELDTDGGFILSGDVRHGNGITDALIIKTDARGQKVWDVTIPHSIINGIHPTQDHYILVGDSTRLNPESAQVHELVNTYARVMWLDRNGNIAASRITSESVTQFENAERITLNVDYHAEAVTLDHNGNIIVLGSFRIPGQNAEAYLAAYSPAADSLWQISYAQQDDDYVNCRSVHVTPDARVVWASQVFSQTQNLTHRHSIFPRVNLQGALPAKAIDRAPAFGATDSRNHAVADIQRSPTGFGVVGTYAETNGESGNIFFLRLNSEFGVADGSARYIDGQELLLNNQILTDNTVSASQDEGLALTATDDGYVLACSMASTPRVGNGGSDILLVKLDFFGNPVWHKTLGGSGDEVVASIRQTEDQGLLIFGTNTINGLSSMMLIKTDKNGNLSE